jgi:hypothetical protein
MGHKVECVCGSFRKCCTPYNNCVWPQHTFRSGATGSIGALHTLQLCDLSTHYAVRNWSYWCSAHPATVCDLKITCKSVICSLHALAWYSTLNMGTTRFSATHCCVLEDKLFTSIPDPSRDQSRVSRLYAATSVARSVDWGQAPKLSWTKWLRVST